MGGLENNQEVVIPVPQSLAEVEQLVLSLYIPGQPPQQLVAIQRRLQELQHSNDGWAIGDSLLASHDATARFFGALTFNIKLNSAGETLDNETRSRLEKTLIHWLFVNAQLGDDRTIRKLCTALAVFYMQNFDKISASVTVLMNCALGENIEQIDPALNIRGVEKSRLSAIEPSFYRMILSFIETLAEEASSKISHLTPEKYAALCEKYESVMSDALFVLHYALVDYRRSIADIDNYTRVSNAAMTALHPTNAFWLLYGKPSTETLTGLSACHTAGINWCITSLSESAIDSLQEIVSSGSKNFTDAQWQVVSQLLRGKWAQEQLDALLDGSETGSDNNFLSLLLAYGDAQVQNLSADREDNEKGPAAEKILDMMYDLLRCEGYPERDDDVIPRALEFWNAFVEHVEDAISEGTATAWFDYAKTHIVRMAQQICIRLRLPSPEEWEQWHADEKKMLRDFRIDVSDLLQSSYRIVGAPLLQIFVEQAKSAAAQGNCIDIETNVCCIVATTAFLDSKNDSAFISLLESSIFTTVQNGQVSSQQARRTCNDLLGQLATFFKRHTQYLPASLNFLVSSLRDAKTVDQAARSLHILCSTCRKELIPELSNFLVEYEIFLTLPTAEEFAIERVSGAVGVLLQALPSFADTITGIETLLKYVDSGISNAQDLLQKGQIDDGKAVANKSMRCLSSIAKSLQAPTEDDSVVDLEMEEVGNKPLDEALKQQRDALQQHVFNILSTTLQILNDDGDIIDEVCNVFKAGFTESVNSPFHFAPNIVVQFFSITTIRMPRLESVLRLGCSFLRSLSRQGVAGDEFVQPLAQQLATLVQNLGDPREDAEIAQSILEMLQRFLPEYVKALLQLQPVSQVETLLSFTINAIGVPEPLPKRAALNFWNSFLDITPATMQADNAQDLLEQVINHYGPSLTTAMVLQIGGSASRLDIEFLAGPVRKLLRRHVAAKSWMETALIKEIPDEKVEPALKRRLVAQLGLVNNNRGTKELLMGFWQQASGTTGYNPVRNIG